jgi:hypothetical protein
MRRFLMVSSLLHNTAMISNLSGSIIKGGPCLGSDCAIRFNSQLKRILVKLLEVLFPFHGKHLFFGVVAFFAAGRHVSLGAFTPSGYGYNVIHCQIFGRAWSAAVITNSFCQAALPPLGFPEFPCSATLPF